MFQSHNLITFNLLTEILIIHTLFFITRCDAHTMHLQQSFLLCFFSEISRSNFLSYFNKLINKYNKTDKKVEKKYQKQHKRSSFFCKFHESKITTTCFESEYLRRFSFNERIREMRCFLLRGKGAIKIFLSTLSTVYFYIGDKHTNLRSSFDNR